MADATTSTARSRLGSVLEDPHRALEYAGVVLLLAIPVLLPGSGVQTWAVYLTYCLLALAIDLVWGYTGLLTLGHAAYFGAGAYLTAKITEELPVVPETVAVFLLAPLFGALLTLAVGWFLFSADIKGSYFAIATLIISVVFERIVSQFTEFLGGFNGLSGIPTLSVAGFELPIQLQYYVVLLLLVVIYIGARRLTNSAFGRALKGIREDQKRTEAFGYNTEYCRLAVFTLSGGIAGLAGGLYATIDGFVSPPIIGFVLSTTVVIWVAVGGRGTLLGAVLGALLIQFLSSTLSDVLLNFWQIILAAVFIAVVIGSPSGIVGVFEQDSRIVRGLRRRIAGEPVTSGAGSEQSVDTTGDQDD